MHAEGEANRIVFLYARFIWNTNRKKTKSKKSYLYPRELVLRKKGAIITIIEQVDTKFYKGAKNEN